MALNVVMIGASRSGKTSILTSMLAQLRGYSEEQGDNRIEDYFFVRDNSDYSGLEGRRIEEVSLRTNQDRMEDLLKTYVPNRYAPKMGQLQGSSSPFSYVIDVKHKIKHIPSSETLSIIFNDVPGEFYSMGSSDANDIIKKSQILIVAVDVPSMMLAKETGRSTLNSVMNCHEEVFNAIQMLGLDCYNENNDENQRNQKLENMLRMVVFVPIKCEYWLQNNLRETVEEEILAVYSNGIKSCKNFKNIQTLILPIETIGSLLFDHHSNEDNSLILKYKQKPRTNMYVYEDTIDGYSSVRCEKINDDMVRLKNGVIYDVQPGDQLFKAIDRGKHPYCYDRGTKLIPYAWYNANSDIFAPKYCQLLFSKILKFSIMDLAQRAGISPWEVTRNMGFWEKLKDWYTHIGTYQNVKQARCFLSNIMELEQAGVLDEKHITYIVNNKDGVSLLPPNASDVTQ